MRALVCAAVVIASALASSACGGSHSSHNQASTDAIRLHESSSKSLPPPLQNFIHSIEAGSPDGRVHEIDVYGPGSRAALVKASSGDVVMEGANEAAQRFYLVVVHGHFVCRGCSGPAGHKPPHGTIETHVWSRTEGSTDFGISSSLPPAMSQLHRLAVIRLS
jgi:hypothetical protein